MRAARVRGRDSSVEITRSTRRGLVEQLVETRRAPRAHRPSQVVLFVGGHEAELVEDEQIDAIEAALEATEVARVARLDQCAHEIGDAPEGNVTALARSFDA